jgi:hypothetical protein
MRVELPPGDATFRTRTARAMLNQTYQHHASSGSVIPPKVSLLPRGYLRYILVRLRVYLILIAFIATSFEAAAAAMVNLYGWTVLIGLFWAIVAYEALPKSVRLLINQKLDKLFQKYPIPLPQLQTQPALIIILILGGIVALGLLGWY